MHIVTLKLNKLLVPLCVLTMVSFANADELIEVSTDSGVFRGHASAYATGVTVFKGIAYASPPVRDLRWKPPVPAIPFAGVRNADSIGPACWQARNSDDSLYARGNLERSEDCLYLNLYSGAADSSDSLPVMVWFHGGGNTAGHGGALIFDGSNLAARGAVIIAANYRLGTLGFLAHPALTAESEHDSSGNYGILDQLQVLQWVQANIANFGGDPDRVTIFGQSAGGTDVCLIMSSPLAEGMVHGVVGESPGCIKMERTLADGDNSGHAAGLEYAGELGVSGFGATTLEQLRAVSAQRLVAAGVGGGPQVDGWVIPDSPYSMLESGGQNKIPVMVGGLAHENHGLQHTSPEINGQQLDGYLQAVFGKAAGQVADAYVYLFTREPPVFRLYVPAMPDLYGDGGQRRFGAYHSGELAYVFDNLDVVGLGWDDDDHGLSELMADYWVSFARNGNPNGDGLPNWPVYVPATDIVQILDSRVRSEVHPKKAELDMLEALYLRQH
ncbi:MAG: carboxylesterase/lipase family protein [Proteobacteria bacterium]|nr:carboxylesterase/lipase family protein [Pseudomonadota bacterium]